MPQRQVRPARLQSDRAVLLLLLITSFTLEFTVPKKQPAKKPSRVLGYVAAGVTLLRIAVDLLRMFV